MDGGSHFGQDMLVLNFFSQFINSKFLVVLPRGLPFPPTQKDKRYKKRLKRTKDKFSLNFKISFEKKLQNKTTFIFLDKIFVPASLFRVSFDSVPRR